MPSPVLGWVLAAIVLTGLLLRWTRTSSQLLVSLIALSPLVVVPLVGLAITTWRTWDRRLGLALVVLTSAYVASFVSFGSVVGCGPTSADDEIAIYTHNVWWKRGEPDALARSIEASDADVLVLQEVTSAMVDALGEHPLLEGDYRYRANEPSDVDTTGLAVWSRYPIGDAAVEVLGASTPVLRTTIESPSGPFRLGAIHVTAPLDGATTDAWDDELDQLAGADPSSPALLVGDFNATDDHEQFRAILEAGWTDAHGPKGCGYDATWPEERIWPTMFRLDHVLMSSHFEALAVDVGDGASSDHRPVIARVRLS
ncbi:MAG: endonuclease/exonuclease/phosphatase family protein [Acidimicrobiales bacterium]